MFFTFSYPTEDSLMRFFSEIHLAKRFPDLIVIEQLDRIIGPDVRSSLFLL